MMSKRTHNFNAGPAALPLAVLESVQSELVDYQGLGLSVMEMSHRSAEYGAIIDDARATITRLYAVPATHEVLFLQGGASLQFAMVPYNLGSGGAFINTGTWTSRALAEAGRIGPASEIWSSKADGFRAVPGADQTLTVPDGTPYVHYASNNTIYGTQYQHLPTVQTAAGAPVPRVCDMSSDFLSRPIDISAFDVIFAGAQKNAGPSGVCVVIIKKSISRSFHGAPSTPIILRYQTQAEKGSMYNTPNTFGIYVLGKVAHWVEDQGGLTAIHQTNLSKANALYAAIDAHPLAKGHAETASRSLMNVTFNLQTPEQEKALLAQASAAGIIGLKGHRSVGGLRASIYNAVPRAAVDAVIELLQGFKG
jgi:phosphoserine aminotransferase